MKKYGIENLKKFSLILIKLGMKLEKIKWNWKSVLFGLTPFILKNFKKITELWKNKKQILFEFKDLDSEEKQELNEYITSKLDLQEDRIEEIIEYILNAIILLSNKIEKIIKLIKHGK